MTLDRSSGSTSRESVASPPKGQEAGGQKSGGGGRGQTLHFALLTVVWPAVEDLFEDAKGTGDGSIKRGNSKNGRNAETEKRSQRRGARFRGFGVFRGHPSVASSG
jgi:hypothetical protein